MSIAGIEIRKARADEYGTVGDLTAEAYVADGLTSEPYIEELKDAAARAEAGVLLVAVDEASSEILGTASLFHFDAGERWAEGAVQGEAVLRMVAVAPRAQRRGIARSLTLDCVRRAREHDARRLILSTLVDNHAARQLYESLGFERNPGSDWEPVPGIVLLSYALTLAEG